VFTHAVILDAGSRVAERTYLLTASLFGLDDFRSCLVSKTKLLDFR
jgi:hypothetical protein